MVSPNGEGADIPKNVEIGEWLPNSPSHFLSAKEMGRGNQNPSQSGRF